mmetsp:Transcript_3799/g.10698  ORF Transcript_3799/g.10698 Transcript_3799/m.10698 type:complete len:204 (+) Transcript_3799:480-1091(+)
MEGRADAYAIVAFHLAEELCRLPVPEVYFSVRVARYDELAVGRHVDLARVAGVGVAAEELLIMLAELVVHAVDNDLVVQGLPEKPFLTGVHGHEGDGVHVRLGDVLDGHRDAVLPHEHLLVIRRRDKAAPFIAERDSVDSAEVLVVKLDGLGRVDVPLDGLLVRLASDEDVLLVLIGVELDAVGQLLGRVGAQALPCLRVPEF